MPLSQRDKELLLNGTPVDRLLPVRRGPMLMVGEDVELVCDCDRSVPRADIFGAVSEPAPGLTVVELIGLCRPCMKATPFIGRYRPRQGRFEEWTPRSGWRFYRFRNPRPWDLVKWARKGRRLLRARLN